MMITIKKLKQVFIFFTLALLMCLQPACASKDCVYDDTYFKASRYSNNKLIEKLNYNKAENTAQIITRTGDLISIKHWACNHHGIHAVMLVGPYPSDDNLDIKKHFKTLSNIALDKTEADIFNDFILKKDMPLKQKPVTLKIENDQYDEFYITYTSVNDSIILEIKVYKG